MQSAVCISYRHVRDTRSNATTFTSLDSVDYCCVLAANLRTTVAVEGDGRVHTAAAKLLLPGAHVVLLLSSLVSSKPTSKHLLHVACY
jgi:hypothetical protein